MDIKPQNVMLCDRQNDTIKIIDFGLAKQLTKIRDKQVCTVHVTELGQTVRTK